MKYEQHLSTIKEEIYEDEDEERESIQNEINAINKKYPKLKLTIEDYDKIKKAQKTFKTISKERLADQRDYVTDGQFSQTYDKTGGASMGYTLTDEYRNPVAFEKKPLFLYGDTKILIRQELLAYLFAKPVNDFIKPSKLKISFHAGSFNKNSLNYISKKVGERGDFANEIENKMNLLSYYKNQENQEKIQKMQNIIWSFLTLDNQRKKGDYDNYNQIVFIKNKIKGLLDSMTQNQSDFMKNNVDFMKNNVDFMKDYVKIFQEWHELYENLEQIYHLMPFLKDIDMGNLVAIRDKSGKISEFKIIDFSVDVNFDFNGKTPNQAGEKVKKLSQAGEKMLESFMKNLIKNTTQHTLKEKRPIIETALTSLNIITSIPKHITEKAHMDVFKELKQKYPDLKNDEDCTFEKFKKFMSERKILKNKKSKSIQYNSFNKTEIFTSEQMKLFLNQLQEKKEEITFEELKQQYPDLQNDKDCTFEKFKKFRQTIDYDNTVFSAALYFNDEVTFASSEIKLFLNQLQERKKQKLKTHPIQNLTTLKEIASKKTLYW